VSQVQGSIPPAAWQTHMATKHRIIPTSLVSVYPYYMAKSEKKGRIFGQVPEDPS
jgi:hypothetical protein